MLFVLTVICNGDDILCTTIGKMSKIIPKNFAKTQTIMKIM